MTQKGIVTILNSLKVAHEKFTWSGKEILHIDSYGVHRWHGFWLNDLDARESFPLSTEFRLARLFKRVNYQDALSCAHDLSFAPSCESTSVLPLVCAQGFIP